MSTPGPLRTAMLALTLMTGAASAADVAGFNAAVDDAAMHNRAAAEHLLHGRTDFAVIELDRLRESWGLFVERYGKDRPAVHRDNPDYVTTMVDLPLRVVTAHMMINFGRLDIAYNSLVATCRELSDLRLAHDVDALAACPPPVEIPRPPD